jgi:hypothetical protein
MREHTLSLKKKAAVSLMPNLRGSNTYLKLLYTPVAVTHEEVSDKHL